LYRFGFIVFRGRQEIRDYNVYNGYLMVENDVLSLDVRRKIYNHIRKSPGLHLREIARELNIPLSTLDYHLYYLKQRALVKDRQDGRYTRYYVEGAGDVGVKEREVISVLRQAVTRSIIMFLILNPNSSHRNVSNHIQLAPSTTTFHLNKLIKLDIVDRIQMGRETSYLVKDSERLSDLLITYRKTFFDESVDRFIETWMGLNPQLIRKKKNEKQ